MALTLELLDEEHADSNFIIIVGENTLLKVIPGKSPLDRDTKLQNILRVSNLPLSPEYKLMKEIVKLSSIINDHLKNYVETHAKSPERVDPIKKAIVNSSVEIGQKEQQLGFTLTAEQFWCFCSQCKAFIGEHNNLMTNCPCGKKIEDEDLERISILEGESRGFLEGGIWFEDYMGTLLRNHGWKGWTHGKILGASGIFHPIDLLAIKDGKVLIAECKTGKVETRDISHFVVQKSDIRSNVGYFLSLDKCSGKSTADLIRGKSDLCLIDEIGVLTDDQIINKIDEHINKFN